MTPTREDLLRLAACFEVMADDRPPGILDEVAARSMARWAKHAAASLPAPDVGARPFAVGDRVRIVCADGPRTGETGVIVADDGTSVPLRVEFDDGTRNWFLRTDVVSAPDVGAQGGALSEGDAKNLEYVANEMVASDGWGDFPKTLRETASRIRTTLANGAGEVERLRAQLTRSRDLHDEDGRAEVERLRENLEATLSSATALATERNEATRERDQLRAELDEAKTRAAMKHGVLRDIAHELGRCHCWDYGCEPADDETLVRRAKELSAAEDERDALRAELDEERKEHKTTRAMWQGLIEKIKELRAELDEARRERDRFRDLWQAAQRDFAAWYIWAGKLCKSPETSAVLREMIDAKLAAAKAGAVVTEDDVRLLRCVVSAPWGSALWSATSVRALADRLSQLVQAREEMGR
jgi:hypothetical protein